MPFSPTTFRFDNTYARDLQGFYTPWQPERAAAPKTLFFNSGLAAELHSGLDEIGCGEMDLVTVAEIFSGNGLPEGAAPIAQCYAGHQFGHFSPQLGDGRALLLGEVLDRKGLRRDIALKGSGRTPYSRNGDGKAAVGPMLREVLIGEALHALGIPTTRALAVVATGEPVYREKILPGAVLTRVAASHIRVGTFEYFAARGDVASVKKLADYSIARHYPELVAHAQQPREDDTDAGRYLAFLRAVAEKQAELIAQWMNAGFIHGVMNTDNMAIAGETIDFGPCAFMEAYDPSTVFSSIDSQGRYAYGRQPQIAQWNLARLAESLLPLLAPAEEDAVALATEVLSAFPDRYQHYWLRGVRAKLGIDENSNASINKAKSDEQDVMLALDWLGLLNEQKVDFTQGWRYLSLAAGGDSTKLRALFSDTATLDAWLARLQARREKAAGSPDSPPVDGVTTMQAMLRVNPRIIPRNHKVEAALTAASEQGDLEPFESLLAAIRRPFDDDPVLAPFAEPAPVAVTACYKTYCGT